ncbi:hypothetical protein EZS27_008195, partial [termite gut metagenome]
SFDKDLANSRTSWYSIWVMFVCGYTVKIILFNDIATLLLTIAVMNYLLRKQLKTESEGFGYL